MKLLFDENISFRLCKRLQDIYPDSTHVSFINLQQVDDSEIWQYAKEKNFIIVTQDSDFNDLSILNGFPPYIIWIKTGNTRVSELEGLLRKHSINIRAFLEKKSFGLIELE